MSDAQSPIPQHRQTLEHRRESGSCGQKLLAKNRTRWREWLEESAGLTVEAQGICLIKTHNANFLLLLPASAATVCMPLATCHLPLYSFSTCSPFLIRLLLFLVCVNGVFYLISFYCICMARNCRCATNKSIKTKSSGKQSHFVRVLVLE